MKWILVLTLITVPLRAEDWTTTDGKTYKDVTVVKVEDDAVTILDNDGGALVPLATLNADLRKRFHYDPAKAQAAAVARAVSDKANAVALEAEANKADAMKQADYKAADADRAKTAQIAQVAAAQQQQRADAKPLFVQIVQVLPDGLLVEPLVAHFEADGDVEGVHFGGGGGGSVYQSGSTTYSPSGEMYFLKDGPQGKADDEKINVTAYRDGTHAYQDTLGAQRTVEQWDCVQ